MPVKSKTLFTKDTKDTKCIKIQNHKGHENLADRAKIVQHLPKSLGMPLYKGVLGREVLV